MTPQQWQLLIGFFVPFVIQLMKRSQAGILKLVNQNTPKINIAISSLSAVFVAMEIHLHYAPGSLTLTWPSVEVMALGFTTFLVQLASQHVSYEAFWRHILPAKANAPDAVATAVNDALKEEEQASKKEADAPFDARK